MAKRSKLRGAAHELGLLSALALTSACGSDGRGAAGGAQPNDQGDADGGVLRPTV